MSQNETVALVTAYQQAHMTNNDTNMVVTGDARPGQVNGEFLNIE